MYKDPHLSVNALFRINILGEVTNPGFYYVSDSEKFTAILAFAGGTTEDADLGNIKLIRNFESIGLDVETIIQEGSKASDFGLQSGDQVFVPRRWWADNSGCGYGNYFRNGTCHNYLCSLFSRLIYFIVSKENQNYDK